jgi:hypothetical protein
MLATDFESEQEGMIVPYPPPFDDIRRNYGFVDLRGRSAWPTALSQRSHSKTDRRGISAKSSKSSPGLHDVAVEPRELTLLEIARRVRRLDHVASAQ